ncbi:MAG: hypothetical protein CW338_07425 [Clostridiales bacterium]|nr:hypothetical protein [Clostridiales bacterium]
MKRIIALLLSVILLLPLVSAQAGGLLPSSQEVFGTYMPSMTLALGKTAAKDEKAGDSRVITCIPFTDADYAAFGAYVDAWGCTAGNYESDGGSVTIPLKKGDAVITFTYDRANGSASVTYPKGTRPEEEKSSRSGGTSRFPAIRNVFGQQMPSMNGVIGKKADRSSENGDGTLVQEYTNITEAQFDAFNAYAESMGCSSSVSTSGNAVTVKYSKGDATMTLVYDDAAETAKVTYSVDAWYDDGTATRTDASGAAVTADSVFGIYVPNASKVLKREADSTVTDGNGITYVYNNFTDEDYNTFGNYMGECGCAVTGYTTQGNTLNIQVEKDGHPFTFIYERDTHTGKVIYLTGTRAEKVALATPTPAVTATPKATAKPTSTPKPQNYTPQQCHDIAIRYIKNRLKNPTSFIENSNYYYTYDGYYTFVIDYSAQNGFGGYNRETYYIEVNYSTGTVQSGFSF